MAAAPVEGAHSELWPWQECEGAVRSEYCLPLHCAHIPKWMTKDMATYAMAQPVEYYICCWCGRQLQARPSPAPEHRHGPFGT